MSTPHTPKPGPRPGAVPGPRPGAHAARKVVAPNVSAMNQARAFGRVDDDGTVYLIRGGETKKIGSWQAGTPEEGLQHYIHRFEDLATEVALLESRLKSHPNDASHIKEKAGEIRNGLDDAAVIGDLDSLEKRLNSIIDGADSAGEKARELKQQLREKAIEQKQKLVAEAEEIAEKSTDWKVAGDRIREILDEWKTIKGIDRKTDDELWKLYSRARDSFNRRRGSHFAELDRGRAAARRIKEDLVEKANILKESTDWNDTAHAFKELMNEWKAAGRAPRDVDDKLWAAFKGAQDYFFNARNAVNDQRDREFAANAEAKDALIDEYTPLIDPAQGLESAREKLRELQEKWEAIGYVPRNRVREYEEKIANLEKRVTEAADAQWRRTDPAAQARAAQFISKVEEFTAQAAEAEVKGNTKKAEQLRAQAQQWQEWADAAINAVENR
ncbi:DUF349 domain-containing protein [Corynebacterium diphtheriae]|uniref:DUF349 domain-containing protein n=1 Tax=Corynebacterium diphtheriae TaxID=1717 RepID=UPI00024683D0|nr:DUF349 domain-containing protein [Corynebacterium diphtheriae]AEX76832.1 hypothetical protein CDHC02_1343 [Corynebacterium diphtheriae HC02]MBG9246670.1 DUF349 domain-containing protein [Corynebacterium diphtheriae bv. mitis]UJM21052.1 DUF349 domain-containing protein [Corynebacterium diphtheriae]CAB0694959.1 hypothetical protein FRC0081_01157 [Corynebacterium diphtheriae]CAB0697065.1 hypothetical protein FRC0037_01311 [Corynebacterium diphtheriae]